jgi:hypothetical protein
MLIGRHVNEIALDQKRCKTLQICWTRTLNKYCEGNEVSLFILRFYLARIAKSFAKHDGGWGAEFCLATTTGNWRGAGDPSLAYRLLVYEGQKEYVHVYILVELL